MIDKIIKDLEQNLNITINKDNIIYYTDGATDSIVFNINDEYLIKTVDENTYNTQIEFLNFYKEIPNFQKVIYSNKELNYICFNFIPGTKYSSSNIDHTKTINKLYNITKQYKEYNHNYYGYLYEDKKTWIEFLNSEIEYSYSKISELNINLDKVNNAISTLDKYPKPKYLIHGDFGTHNFITNGDTLNVIDPMPVVGDYLYDFYFAIFSDTDIFTTTTIEELLKYFDREIEVKKAMITITFFIRMSRAFVYDKENFDTYLKYYNEVI